MNIKLTRMEIKNFKGIKNFVYDFNNENTFIYGDNATGKSTLQDAFMWCLFGKDASNSNDTKFSIRPIDPVTKEVIHKIDINVVLTLDIDGVVKSFSKTKKEKWTKKRGSQEQIFSGNENILEIDNVPVNGKEWETSINELGGEDLFKMVTNVLYFNQMNWQSAREIIFKLVPNISDNDVMDSNRELLPLKALASESNHSVEDLTKIAKSTIAKLNNDLKEIPARIDELSSINFDSVKDFNLDKNKEEMSKLKERLQFLNNSQNENVDVNQINEINDKIMKLMEEKNKANNDMTAKRNQYQLKVDKAESEFINKKQELTNILAKVNSNGANCLDLIKETENKIERFSGRKNVLLEEYKLIKERVFNGTNCSLCGQRLPEEQLEKAQEKFNGLKAKDLEYNITTGKAINKQIEELELKLIEYRNNDKLLREEYSKAKNELDNLKEEVIAEVSLDKENQLLKDLENKINELDQSKKSLQNNNTSNNNDIERQDIETKIEALQASRIKYEMHQENKTKIEKLEVLSKEKLKEQEKQFRIQNLCDAFIVAKSNLITDKVNENFKMVEFKMFETQINGGINPTCVATVNGVPFADLNTARKIKAGIDIINALNHINGIVAPIWIDNAESINWNNVELNTNAQIIKLFKADGIKPMQIKGEIKGEIK